MFEINCRISLKCSDNKTSLTHTALIYQNQFIHMTASVWAHCGKNRYVKQCKKKSIIKGSQTALVATK